MLNQAGPWGTGPYKLVEGFSLPDKRSDRVILEANPDYWDPSRFPRVKRIVFDNTLSQKEGVELVKSGEGRVDLVTGLSPLETLRVAESPFAQVVKGRGALSPVFGMFNTRKTGSPWRDVRLRQAVNYAINREDLIRYATKGNGTIIPALVPDQGFGYDPDLTPYPFDPAKTRDLLREAGYPDGLALSLIAPEDLAVQATVVGKMLEQVGLTVEVQMLDAGAYNRKTFLSRLDASAQEQAWDIALASRRDAMNFPVFGEYHFFALDGPYNWIGETPALQGLYDQVLRTVDPEQQQALIRQMERHTHERAYFLFLYNPIELYAVNKAVDFVPDVHFLNLAGAAVTERHWSLRQAASKQ
jgi:peptide/nickel transport system substrate-binding protein